MIAVAVVVALVATAAAYWYFNRCGADCASEDPFALDAGAGDTEVAVAALPGDETGAAAEPPAAVVVPEAAPVVDPAEIVAPGSDAGASLATGQLDIRSNPPGALVTVDGRMEGTTPVVVRDLEMGPHMVQVARPGFVPVLETVEITAGAASRTLTIDLAAGVPEVAPRFGALDVDSRPRGAVVTIDGRRAGVTPLQLTSIDPGSRVVRLELDGYRPIRADVTIRPGERARLAVTLEPGGQQAR